MFEGVNMNKIFNFEDIFAVCYRYMLFLRMTVFYWPAKSDMRVPNQLHEVKDDLKKM